MASAGSGSGGEPGAPADVIGWSEYVTFLEWDLPPIKAKVDTGARTSALHVEAIQRLRGGRVRFEVVLHRRRADRRVTVEAPVTRRARVRSSSGEWTWRYVVPARIRLGPVDKEIEVSLVSREDMIFRMLLGRSAFSGDFLIDASRQCVQGRPRRVRAATRKRGRTSP